MTMDVVYDSLRWYDYLIVVAALSVSLGIGIYYALTGGKQKTTKEYFLGDRKMNILPVAMSVMFGRISGTSLLGIPAEMYEHGITGVANMAGWFLITIPSAIIMVPVMYDLGFTSTNQYLEARYNTKILRLVAALFFIIQQVMFLGLVVYAPAIALEAIAGVPFVATVLVAGLVCTVYSTIGGMKGVVKTDVFQGLVMHIGILLVIIVGLLKVGGISEVWQTAKDNDRLNFNYSWSPLVRRSFQVSFFASFATFVGTPTDQKTYQRLASMRSKSAAKWMIIINVTLSCVIYLLIWSCGMVVFTYYYKLACDPLQTGQIRSANQIFPYFVMDGLKIPGVPGLYAAVLLCGVLSSFSTCLNCMAAVTWADFIEPYFFKDVKEFTKTLINKITVFTYGLMGICFTFMFAYMKGNTLQIQNTVFSAFNGPVNGVFFTGLFFPWVEWKAALISLFGGFALQVSMSIGSSLTHPWRETLPTNIDNCTSLGYNNTVADYGQNVETNPLYMVSFQLYELISTLTTIVLALLVSLFVRNKKPVNPRYLVPVADSILCCLPDTWRDTLRCQTYRESQEVEKEPKPFSLQLELQEQAEEVITKF